ncbi:gp32 [Sphingomonas phage PAU]|uniref:gp32 n=1 Tax=Sphingomonas phage PAU TaxID=1150991 RepID=UPI0002573125|nr:gp32 [Sphingomonas phage PAU]AFF28030.1 gp32 [Sphingomonas phage PAU]
MLILLNASISALTAALLVSKSDPNNEIDRYFTLGILLVLLATLIWACVDFYNLERSFRKQSNRLAELRKPYLLQKDVKIDEKEIQEANNRIQKFLKSK